MDRRKPVYRFDLDEQFILDNDVRAKSLLDLKPINDDRHYTLSLERNASLSEAMA